MGAPVGRDLPDSQTDVVSRMLTRWHARWSRLVDLSRPSRLEGDIDDELRFHFDEEVEAGLARGLTPEAARRAALDSLGGTPIRLREELRDARGVSLAYDFRRDVRHGVRLLRRDTGFTAVVLCTLAVAIGGVVAAFSLSDAWLFRPLRFPEANRLVVAFMANAKRPTEPALWMPYRAYLSWKESARSFSSVSAAFFRGATWQNGSDAKSLVGMRVTPEFFATLGVPAFRGRHLSANDSTAAPAIVLSHGFWQRELGGAITAIGSTITLSDVVYDIVGVMPPDFDVRLLDRPEGAAFWTLFRPGERGYEPGGLGPVTLLARLADGVTIDAARDEAAAIMTEAERAYPVNFTQPDAAGNRFVVNLSSLQHDNTRTLRATLLTVLGAALALLLIAAMNVGVLLLGRGLRRRGEVAVRHAIGAGRARLVRQFLTESLVLSAAGGTAGVALAWIAIRLFVMWNPLGTLPPDGIHIDLRALAAATAAMVTTTIVAGLIPAWRVSSSSLGASVRSGDGHRVSAPAQRAQWLMLVAQVAMSTLLLVCAALLVRTVLQLRSEPLGFATQGVWAAEVSLPVAGFPTARARNTFLERISAQLGGRPAVRAVAASTVAPLTGSAYVPVSLDSADSAATPRMSAPTITIGYFEALDIPLLAGRGFDRRDTAEGRPVVVLNARAAAQLFGGVDRALGRRLRLGDTTWREVIGVVGNVSTTFFNTLEWRMDPMVYRPAAQALAAVDNPEAAHVTLWLHVRAERTLVAEDIRAAAASVSPRAAVVSVQPIAEMVAAATRQPAFRMLLLLCFCAGSLLLAAVGIYGVVAQAVGERLREIAIRIALGAEPRVLVVSLVRSTVLAGMAGLGIGALLAVLLARVLQSMLYGVDAGDAISLTAAGLILLSVTVVAAALPARRATNGAAVHLLKT